MMNFDSEIKLYNRPYEEMGLRELYAEQTVHNWHKNRMRECIKKLQRRRWWLEQNKPIIDKAELDRQYADGEISGKEYRAANARRVKAINHRMHVDDRMKYAELVAAHEEAVAEYLQELKVELEAQEAERLEWNRYMRGYKRPGGASKYDPRKRTSKYNYNKVTDPNRKWATRTEYKPMPRLQKARARWKESQRTDRKGVQVQKRMQPIVTWDVDKLRQIAKDRGYFTDVAMVGQIAESLNLTIKGANALITNGKLSWGQCIVIGALFEMTPKEFCDVFLSGYFREVADGVYRAYVEDTEALLDKPYQPRPKEVNDEAD